MILEYKVENFKNLMSLGEESSSLHLNPLNVFIGPNGCGKSSLLQSIDFLRGFFYTSIEIYFKERSWNFHDIPNLKNVSKIIKWYIKADIPNDINGNNGGIFEYNIELNLKSQPSINKEILKYRKRENDKEFTLLSIDEEEQSVLRRTDNQYLLWKGVFGKFPSSAILLLDRKRFSDICPELFHFKDWINGIRSVLIWDPAILRSPDRGKHTELGERGEHLAPVLSYIKYNHPQKFKELIRRVSRLFPSVSDISVKGGKAWGWKTIHIHEKSGSREVIYNSRQASDGLLRLLAVATLLYLDKPPNVLLFEEPENGLHPRLLAEVVSIMRDLSLRKPPNRCQVLFTTHNPYVLDEFINTPHEVFVVERGKAQGESNIVRITDKQGLNLARITDDRSLGEAWFTGLIEGSLTK